MQLLHSLSHSRAHGKDWYSPMVCRSLSGIPVVAAGLRMAHKFFCSLMFKNSRSMWLACPTKGFAFLSMRPHTGHFPSLLFSFPFVVGWWRAGMEGAWCAGLPPPRAPSLAEFGEAGRLVCACSMCWNVWVLWHTHTRHGKQTCALYLLWVELYRFLGMIENFGRIFPVLKGFCVPRPIPTPAPQCNLYLFFVKGKQNLFLFFF